MSESTRKPWVTRRSVLLSVAGILSAGSALALIIKHRLRPTFHGGHAQVPSSATFHSTDGRFSIHATPVPLGGGGFVTGIDISSDGRRQLCRTDVGGAYIREITDRVWRPLFTVSSLGTQIVADFHSQQAGISDGNGVAAVCFAPSNSNIIYASFRGRIWKSTDAGRSIKLLRLPAKRMFANNGLQRLYNRTMAVSPLDPDQVVVGTWGDGAWFSADGGQRWSELDLPRSGSSIDGKPGVTLFAYEKAAGGRLLAFVSGLGLFISHAGAESSFVFIPGGPQHISTLVAATDGSTYLCEQTTNGKGRLYVHTPGGRWKVVQPPREAITIAQCPSDPRRFALIDANGVCMESLDQCATFTERNVQGFVKGGGEVQWMQGLDRIFPAEAAFDPITRDLIVAHGVGIARLPMHPVAEWLIDQSAGIETLMITSLVSGDGSVVASAWDKPFWRVRTLASYTNDFSYPVQPRNSASANIVAFSTSLDAAADDPNFLVGIVAPPESAPGYSNDGGSSWLMFDGAPATGWGSGGSIAVSTSSNIVILPASDVPGAFTHDGGKNWSPIKLDGSSNTRGFSPGYFVPRHVLSADKQRPGTFALTYATITANGDDDPKGGVWITHDGGRNWQQTLKGAISAFDHSPRKVAVAGADARQRWGAQLSFVPLHSGELLYTPHSDAAADPFFWSRNDGASWSIIPHGVRNVTCFGFGKGFNRPAVYFWGEVGGSHGLFVTFDWFSTPPSLLSAAPFAQLADPSCITGDMNRFGRVYVGSAGVGCVVLDIARS